MARKSIKQTLTDYAWLYCLILLFTSWIVTGVIAAKATAQGNELSAVREILEKESIKHKVLKIKYEVLEDDRDDVARTLSNVMKLQNIYSFPEIPPYNE